MLKSAAYDAFISYSHAVDGQLAPAVQRCLHKVAKRWYQARAVRVFRDQVSLAANPDLWATIEHALEQSRYFIYMASPGAAASPWVRREIEFWKENREVDTFLIAITDGEAHWDHERQDFDWKRTTALPDSLSQWFQAEPMWVDLRWARNETQLSPDHVRFRDVVASLSAPLHGIPKDDLDSEDVRQHRLARRARRAAVTALALLTVSALVLGGLAYEQRGVARERQQEAERQSRTALSRALAADAEGVLDDDPLLASRLALTALAVEPTAQARRTVMATLDTDRHVVAFVRPPFDFDETSQTRPATASMISEVASSADGGLLAFANDTDTEVRLWDVRERRSAGRLTVPPPANGGDGDSQVVGAVEMSADGKTLVSYQEGQLRVWDVASRTVTRSIPYVADRPSFYLSPDGRWMAAMGGDIDDPGPRAGRRPVLTVWDLVDGESIATSRGWNLPTGSVSYTADGRYLLVGEEEANARPTGLARLDLATGQWLQPLSVPPGLTAAAAAVPRLALVREDESNTLGDAIELWDYETQQQLASRPIPGGQAGAIAISEDGAVVVVGTGEGEVYASDATLSTWQLLTRHQTRVLDVAVSADGQLVTSTSEDYDVTLSAPRTDHRMDPLTTLDPGVFADLRALEVSPDGTHVAAYGTSGLRLFEAGDPSRPVVLSEVVLSEVGPSGYAVPEMSWSADGRFLGAVIGDTVFIWDAHTGRQIAVHELQDPAAGSGARISEELRLLPQTGLLLVEEGTGGGVSLVDYRTAEVVQTLPWSGGFTVSGDGRTVVVVQDASLPDGTVMEVWRWLGGRFHRVDEIRDGVYADGGIAVNADGTVLAMATQRRVVMRRVDGGRRVTLRPPDPEMSGGSLAFSADGQTLIQAGGAVVSLWDVNSGLALGSWQQAGVEDGAPTAPQPEIPIGTTVGTSLNLSNGALGRWVPEADRWHRALCSMALQDLDAEERARYLDGADVSPMCD